MKDQGSAEPSQSPSSSIIGLGDKIEGEMFAAGEPDTGEGLDRYLSRKRAEFAGAHQ